MIRVVHPETGSWIFAFPDPGAIKAPDPGIRNTGSKINRELFLYYLRVIFISWLTLIFSCTQAIELDPTELTFHSNLAAVYFEMKDYEKVRACFKKFIIFEKSVTMKIILLC